jgi:hypothetical protein
MTESNKDVQLYKTHSHQPKYSHHNNKTTSMISPLAFRPPLVLDANENASRQHQQHGHYEPAFLRQLSYRMFVACHVLRLGTVTRFTAVVLLHRYSHAVTTGSKKSKPQPQLQPNNKNHKEEKDLCEWKWVAAACLFLACKAEEEPRRLRDVINLAHQLLAPSAVLPTSSSTSSFQEEEGYELLNIRMDPPQLDEAYWQAKKQIVAAEQTVLRWLAFDVSVSHPHRAVRVLLDHMVPSSTTTTATVLQQQKLQLIAFRRLNDALFYAPALCHGALDLACAAIVLATEEEKEENGATTWVDQLPMSLLIPASLGSAHWWNAYQVSDETLQSTKEDLKTASVILKTNPP